MSIDPPTDPASAPETGPPGPRTPGAPAAAAGPPPDVAAGDASYLRGDYRSALLHYRRAVQLRPGDAGAHYKLAMAAWALRRFDLVEPHFQQALRLAPGQPQLHEAMGQWYLEAANIDRALEHSARAVELAPGNAAVAISRAFVLDGAGRTDEAWRAIEPIVASGAASARLATVFGRIAPAQKRTDQALEMVRRVLATPNLPPQQAAPLHFTAAALLDRLGRYDEAFAHARRAHAAGRRPYDPAEMTRRADRRINYFTPEKLHALPRATRRSRRPVFIVGMIRSGTSLVEQILASHPDVYGGGELAVLSRVANLASRDAWAEGDDYPEYLDSLSVRKANKMAGDYLAAVAALNDRAAYVTDKMPMNFLYLGLIGLLFPDCQVIHCTRDALDTCLSCYMTPFANGHEFTQDLRHLGAYYRDYERLMGHWKTVVNFPMIEVRYEDVVADTEGQARRLLEFLDLPWDERCLRFHENKRAVATASNAQVRQPIYASSVGRWRHYEKHLGELVEALAAGAATGSFPK